MKSNLLLVKRCFFLVLVLTMVFAQLGYSQEREVAEFPNRPINYIIAVPPGGTTDLMHRLIAKDAEKFLKQPIVVQNKPGGAFYWQSH